MFPDFRLMIAATLASILALICGFGAFAAFRVSHEPLARPPPTMAALEGAADKGARLTMAFAEADSFDRRFQVSALPAPGAPSAPEVTATVPSDTTTPQSTLPSDNPAAPAVDVALAAPAADTTLAIPSPEAAMSDAEHQAGADVAEPAGGERATAPQIDAEAVAPDAARAVPEAKPEADAPPTIEQAELTPPAANGVNAADKGKAEKTTNKAGTADKTRLGRAAARTRRWTRLTVRTPARGVDQTAAAAQSGFQVAPQTTPRRTAKAHQHDPNQQSTPAPSAAVGGPYVSPPGQ